MIGARFGPYEITARLGTGGMGEVYRATDTKLGRDVAIKLLPAELASDAERLARFEREAKLLASLNHPQIAHVYGFESTTLETGTTVHFLAMELVEGEDLSERLKRGAIPVDEALDVAKQVAEALEEAHERGIVHRDLKPGNVKVTPDGKVKVLDFGLAKAFTDEPVASSSGDVSHSPTLSAQGTRAGVILGTASYMSPEQARGKTVDKRADIWAFGVVLYEMLTGKRLFTGETTSDVLAAVLTREPDWAALPAPTPPAIRRLLRECLERNPRNRLRDIGDARIAIEERGTGIGAEPARSGPTRPRRPGILWLVAALVLGLALGGIVTGGLVWGRLTAARKPPSFERLTFRAGHFTNARFAPDGQTVFLSADWDHPEREIFQVRPKAGELSLGLRGAELLSVSRSGELAILLPRYATGNPYWKTGTLAVVSASGGTPRALAEDVVSADWGPDGKSLAVLRREGGGLRLEYPLGTPIYTSSLGPHWVRVSPRGDEVAFWEGAEVSYGVRTGVAGSQAIVSVNRAGVRRVWSAGWADWWNLAWSPDGEEIWFGATRGGYAAALSAVDRQGRVRPLLAAPGAVEMHDVAPDGRVLLAQVDTRSNARAGRVEWSTDRDLSWLEGSHIVDLSADGREVLLRVFSEREPGAATTIYLRALDGSPAVRIGSGSARELSRDGKWVLAIRDEDVVALPTAAGEERTLAKGVSGLADARWMPDGKAVLVAVQEGDGYALDLVPSEGGPSRRVPASLRLGPMGREATFSPVSPDGRNVAASTEPGRVTVVDLEGGGTRAVPGTGPNDIPVQWTRDGRGLFVFDAAGLPAKAWVVDVASGRRRLWRELGPPNPEGVAGLTRVAVTPDATAYAYSYWQFNSTLYVASGLR